MGHTKRKNSRELQRSSTKEARTESDSLDELHTTHSSIDTSVSSGGGSPRLADCYISSQKQRRITDFLTESKSTRTQSPPAGVQSTPLSQRHNNSVFEVSDTHNALLDIATGDIFATPGVFPTTSPSIPPEFVTIKATDFQSLLTATNNMQQQLVGLTSEVSRQKDQLAASLKNQDKIIKELNSLKVAAQPTDQVNRDPAAAPSVETVHPAQAKHVQRISNTRSTNTRSNPTRNKAANQQPKKPTRGRAPVVETITNNLDEHIDKYLPMWRKKHFYRRSEYKRHYMSKEKSKVIQDHISKKYIPCRFRPRQTHSKDEYILEENHSYATMRHEMNKCTYHSENARKNFEATDQEILETINGITLMDDEIKSKLKELWILEVTNAVEKAHELCEYNLIYLRNLPQKEPYVGFKGISANDQNRKINKNNRHSYNTNNRNRHQSGFH